MLKFFVRRPITTLMFVLVWVVLGLVSFPKMNIERTPSVDFPMVTATFVYPGAAPEEIESQVVKRAEDAMSEVSELKNITSYAYENSAFVMAEFNLGVNVNDKATEIKTKLDFYGVGVSAVGSPLGKIPLDGDMVAHLETARRVMDTANVLGARYVRMFSFYAPTGKDITAMRGEVLYALEKLVLRARAHGVTLCHENEAKIYGDIPARCKEITDYFGGEMKCVFDMGNFVLEQVEPYAAYTLMQKDVAYFHIKDAFRAGAIVPPGKGEARIADILTAHKRYANEDFFVSLEPHLQLFSGLNALVGRSFENPYHYKDAASAFADAVKTFRELTE
jgi:sugar phosphate isomerase/epimerase